MAKEITFKDAIYALQYAHETLVRSPTDRPGVPAKWSLTPSGNRVKESIANQVCSQPGVASAGIGRDGRHEYRWSDAA